MLLTSNDIYYFFIIRNWLGQLKLYFELYHGRTVLVKRWHRGPFYVQRAFYDEDKVPHVYLLHPPGGLVGGDQLSLMVHLGPGSRALLTTVGASKFYRSNGPYVYLKQRFHLSKNSVLEWLPQSNIFFSCAKVIIDSIFIIDEGARCIVFDMLCFDPSSLREGLTQGMILNIFLSIFFKSSLSFKERIRIDYTDDPIFYKFGRYRISAVLFAIPGDSQILHNVRILIKKYSVEVWGATLLDNLLMVRLLSNNDDQIRILLRILWCFLRPIIIGEQPVTPRIWST